MLRLLSLMAAALLALPAAAGAQDRMPEVAPAVAIAAGGDCVSLPGAFDAAERHLAERGWERTPVTPRPGEDPADVPVIYARAFVLLILRPSERGRSSGTICMIMASMNRSVGWRELVEAASAALGGPPVVAQDGHAMWSGGGKSILLSLEGGRDAEMTILVAPDSELRD